MCLTGNHVFDFEVNILLGQDDSIERQPSYWRATHDKLTIAKQVWCRCFVFSWSDVAKNRPGGKLCDQVIGFEFRLLCTDIPRHLRLFQPWQWWICYPKAENTTWQYLEKCTRKLSDRKTIEPTEWSKGPNIIYNGAPKHYLSYNDIYEGSRNLGRGKERPGKDPEKAQKLFESSMWRRTTLSPSWRSPNHEAEG